ncbi:hypothetical protein V8C44DRAFT_353750 [Trichoderma aethiopicum]
MFPTAASDAPSWPRRGAQSDRCQMQERSLSLGRIDDQGDDKDRMVAMLGESLETSWTHTVGRTISDPPCIFGLTFSFRIFSSIFLGMTLSVAYSVYHSLPDPQLHTVRLVDVSPEDATSAAMRRFFTISATECLSFCQPSLFSMLFAFFKQRGDYRHLTHSTKTSSVIVYHDHSRSIVFLRRPPDNAATALSPPFKLDPYFRISQASSCR